MGYHSGKIPEYKYKSKPPQPKPSEIRKLNPSLFKRNTFNYKPLIRSIKINHATISIILFFIMITLVYLNII